MIITNIFIIFICIFKYLVAVGKCLRRSKFCFMFSVKLACINEDWCFISEMLLLFSQQVISLNI